MYGIELSQSPGFSFRFKQGQNISLSNRSLDVSDDLSILFAQKFDFYLGTLSLGSSTTQDLDHASQCDGFVHTCNSATQIETMLNVIFLNNKYRRAETKHRQLLSQRPWNQSQDLIWVANCRWILNIATQKLNQNLWNCMANFVHAIAICTVSIFKDWEDERILVCF